MSYLFYIRYDLDCWTYSMSNLTYDILWLNNSKVCDWSWEGFTIPKLVLLLGGLRIRQGKFEKGNYCDIGNVIPWNKVPVHDNVKRICHANDWFPFQISGIGWFWKGEHDAYGYTFLFLCLFLSSYFDIHLLMETAVITVWFEQRGSLREPQCDVVMW